MANIFTAEPPQWLTAIAKPADTATFSQDVGMVLGAGLIATQPDPNAKPKADGTQPLKGFGRGLYEARENQTDPNWMVKTEQMKAAAAGNWARAATEWQQYNTTAKDAAAWATKDLPALTKYRDEKKTNPNAEPPVMESTQGEKAMQQMNQFELRKTMMENQRTIAEEKIKNSAVQQKNKLAWENGLTELTPDQQLEIEASVGPGQFRDEQGNLTVAANQAQQNFRQKHNLTPVGQSAASIRATSAEKIAGIRTASAEKIAANKLQAELNKPLAEISKLLHDRNVLAEQGASDEELAVVDMEIKNKLKEDALYTKEPEVKVFKGKSFLFWGKNSPRALDDAPSKLKSDIELSISEIKGLQQAHDREPNNPTFIAGLVQARQKYNRLYVQVPVDTKSSSPPANPAPAAAPDTNAPANSNDPLGLFK